MERLISRLPLIGVYGMIYGLSNKIIDAVNSHPTLRCVVVHVMVGDDVFVRRDENILARRPSLERFSIQHFYIGEADSDSSLHIRSICRSAIRMGMRVQWLNGVNMMEKQTLLRYYIHTSYL